MGCTAIFRCLDCDNSFQDTLGGASFQQFLCTKCGTIIKGDLKDPPKKCPDCKKGKMILKAGPICPKCGSKDAHKERVLEYFD